MRWRLISENNLKYKEIIHCARKIKLTLTKNKKNETSNFIFEALTKMNNRKETPFLRNEEIARDPHWRKWYLVDAENQKLGRLATKISNTLRGKHKPQFTEHVDSGDFVVVINAEKVALSGNKMLEKTYYWHTGYPGGIKNIKANKLLDKKPCELVYKAVKGMMPKNALNRHSLEKLKIYVGNNHPHLSQKPEILKI